MRPCMSRGPKLVESRHPRSPAEEQQHLQLALSHSMSGGPPTTEHFETDGAAAGRQLAVARPPPPPPGGGVHATAPVSISASNGGMDLSFIGMVPPPVAAQNGYAMQGANPQALYNQLQSYGGGMVPVNPLHHDHMMRTRKMNFAKAMGLPVDEHKDIADQPEWAPRIRKAGLLARKAEGGKWKMGVFFIFHGYMACCESQRVEMSTLDLGFSVPGYAGEPQPTPLANGNIFCGEKVREFQIEIQINAGAEGTKKVYIDLAAETVETREQWLDEIYMAGCVGKGYGDRPAYVPKSLRNATPESQSRMKEATKAASDAVALSGGGGRSCGDDSGCVVS